MFLPESSKKHDINHENALLFDEGLGIARISVPNTHWYTFQEKMSCQKEGGAVQNYSAPCGGVQLVPRAATGLVTQALGQSDKRISVCDPQRNFSAESEYDSCFSPIIRIFQVVHFFPEKLFCPEILRFPGKFSRDGKNGIYIRVQGYRSTIVTCLRFLPLF